MTSRSDNPDRTIRFTDRVSCPVHGPVMVLVKHKLSEEGRKWSGRGMVSFFRCTGMVKVTNSKRTIQCAFMRPNKYQKRQRGERHK